MIVLTLGTFDVPHAGHLNFLRQCGEYGQVVIGLNSDEFIHEYKGSYPLFSYVERYKLLNNFGYTIKANISSGRDLIKDVHPNILAIGSDWAVKDYYKQIGMTQEELDLLGIQLLYIPYTRGISTTEIKARC